MPDYFAFEIDDIALNAMLRAPGGDVWNYTHEAGLRVLQGARRDVGVKTGFLRASLHERMGIGRFGPESHVGSDVRYALVHHQGSSPHLIRARQGRVLAFNKRGVRIFARQVNHPGTSANRYLSGNLWRAII